MVRHKFIAFPNSKRSTSPEMNVVRRARWVAKVCSVAHASTLLGALLGTMVERAAVGAETGAPVPSAETVTQVVDGREFIVAAGFTLQRVSRSELVQRPIVADFDADGHLFVADSSGSNDDVQTQLEVKPHRIMRLTDADDDGVYDSSVEFADKMMFPEGVLCHAGSVFVSAPPAIWRLTDDDGDGRCDRREIWFDGRTLTGCANDLHGPYLGPDGWIYWCKGAFAEQTYERPEGASWSTRAAHIFRRRLEGGPIEPVMTGGMDNPVEVAFLPSGERFFTTTFLQHPGGGRRDGLIHAIYGGVYGKSHAVLDGHPRTGDLMPPLVHLGPAAPSGLTCLRSTALGETFRDALVATCFNLHQVNAHQLLPDGATYRTVDQTLVASNDLDFHPTDVVEDADGSLLILDTGGWYKLCCPTSQLHKPDVLGAIYRLQRIDHPTIADPRGKQLPWNTMTTGELVKYLSDPRPFVSRKAADLLAAHADALATVTHLRHLLVNHRDERVRAAAVWVLTRLEINEARQAVRQSLSDSAVLVRMAALHSVSVHRDQDASARVGELLADPAPAVRRAAAEAAGRLASPELLKPLTGALADGIVETDRVLQHSLVYAVWEHADAPALRTAMSGAPDSARGWLLMALDQIPNSQLDPAAVFESLASKSRATQRAAAWVLGRHPEWGAAFIVNLSKMAQETDPSSLADSSTEDLLTQLLVGEQTQQAMAEWLASTSSHGLKTPMVWNALRRAHAEKLSPALQESIARQLELRDAELDTWILRSLAGGRAPLDEPHLQKTLRLFVEDPQRDAARRLEAAALQPEGQPLEDRLFQLLITQSLDENLESGLRGLAVRALIRAKLNDHQSAVVVERLPSAGPVELGGLLEAFRNLPDGALADQLIQALTSAPALAVLPPATLRDSLGHLKPETRKPLDETLAKLHADVANQPQKLADLLERLPSGDLRRGQAVFHSTKAACFSCHEMGYRGGDVGPDLTRIGKIRSRRDLLEAIVFPSSSFVRSFEPQTVITVDGEIHQGVIRDDQPHQLVLISDQRKRIEIPRETIEEIRPSRISIMPSGLDQLLTEQELADLVTFLEAAK